MTTTSIIRTNPRPICYLCGTHGKRIYEALQDRLYAAPGIWSLSRCENANCGLVWLDPGPVEDDLGKIYERYFTHESSEPAWRSRHPLYRIWVHAGSAYRAAIRNTTMGQARRRADAFYLEGMPPGRLLDVGCGDGRLMAQLQGRGWVVEGQETDASAAEQARRQGLTVHVGSLHSLSLPAARYDAVTLSHVVEHVYDPIALVTECRRLLKPGGKLVALTPNFDSYGHQRFNACWVALDPPRHLFLFTVLTLGQIASRASFDSFRITTNAVRAQYISIASEDIRAGGHHDLGKTYRLPQLARAMIFEWQAWRAQDVNPAGGDELVLEAMR